MVTIVKKGTNPSAFKLKNGKLIVLEAGGILNTIKDEDFDDLMKEYGSFVSQRIVSDKNPCGCFIISDKRQYAADMSNEIGDEIKDNSAPIEVKKQKKRK